MQLWWVSSIQYSSVLKYKHIHTSTYRFVTKAKVFKLLVYDYKIFYDSEDNCYSKCSYTFKHMFFKAYANRKRTITSFYLTDELLFFCESLLGNFFTQIVSEDHNISYRTRGNITNNVVFHIMCLRNHRTLSFLFVKLCCLLQINNFEITFLLWIKNSSYCSKVTKTT